MKWEDISSTIGKVAPMLGTLLAPATGGASLAIGALVSSALGVDNTPEAVEAEIKRNPEALLKIKELEQKENESLRKQVLNLAKLDQEKYLKAHDTYQAEHEMADTIAKRIIEKNLPYIAILVMLNLVLIYYMKTEVALLAIASNIIGITIGNLFAERQAIVNFFFGSSSSSKEKTKMLTKQLKT